MAIRHIELLIDDLLSVLDYKKENNEAIEIEEIDTEVQNLKLEIEKTKKQIKKIKKLIKEL